MFLWAVCTYFAISKYLLKFRKDGYCPQPGHYPQPSNQPASPAAAPWRRRPRTSPHAPPEAHQRFFWVWAAIKTDLYWKLRAGDLRRSSRAQYRRVFVLNISGGRTFFGFGDPKNGLVLGYFRRCLCFAVSRERYARRLSSQYTSFLETKISALFMCGGR